ncbi:putative ubiquitin-conjugating enzyme E2 24 [Bienertia sinuspersici]
MHGDIVRSTGNPSGQMGKIVDLKTFVDLENVFGEVIKDVDSVKLSRMRSIMAGDYVIHGPWLGRVEKVVEKVGIIFDDGTKYEVMATDQAQLLPLSPNLLDDSLYPYHPGQRLDLTAPTRLQDPKSLTMLSYFSHANWQLGDWCILPSETRLQRTLNSNIDEIFSILKKKIKFDVMWQDGSCSFGTVKVKWESSTVGVTKDSDEGKMEETVSAYELVEHPDFSFNIGDIVFLYGNIEVEWASGVTTKVDPYKILRVEKDDGSVATHILPEQNVAEFNDGLADYERQTLHHQIHPPALVILLQTVKVAIEAPTSSVFLKLLWDSLLVLLPKVDSNSENIELLSVARTKGLKQFKQFDIVGDCSDNHFADAEGKGAALFAKAETISVRIYEERMDLLRAAIHFEELVEEHFERRSQQILSACKGYMEGMPIGFGEQNRA